LSAQPDKQKAAALRERKSATATTALGERKMMYSDLNPLEQAAACLHDCGLVYVTLGNKARSRFEPLVRLGLAESAEMTQGGTAYRLTQHGRATLKASGVVA
jgi:hypothetical protein